jgi:hypothetical protein
VTARRQVVRRAGVLWAVLCAAAVWAPNGSGVGGRRSCWAGCVQPPPCMQVPGGCMQLSLWPYRVRSCWHRCSLPPVRRCGMHALFCCAVRLWILAYLAFSPAAAPPGAAGASAGLQQLVVALALGWPVPPWPRLASLAAAWPAAAPCCFGCEGGCWLAVVN